MLTTAQKRIHWLGAGLSSVPGLRHLAEQGLPMIVWNRTVSKAETALSDIPAPLTTIQAYDEALLGRTLQADEIVISMLPASKHLDIATLCLQKGAHLLTASYLSPEMAALNEAAKAKNLCFVNEIGLDPGLDHILAYEAVEAFQNTPHWNDPSARVQFRSLCGGLSEVPNRFCYRFSWSPIGVLKALRTPAAFIDRGSEQQTSRVWEHTTQVTIENETFEAYPNRDSLPYIADYGLAQGNFQLQTFMRGSLRLAGWHKAWQPIFQQIQQSSEEDLTRLSETLWKEHAFARNENDRVVLFVNLESDSPRYGKWRHEGIIDHLGTKSGSAMGYLVSLPIALMAISLREGSHATGVSTAPKAPQDRKRILCKLAAAAGIRLTQKTFWSNA